MISYKIFFVLFILINCYTSNKSKSSSNNGYNDAINVHIVPHTHDDAGWLWDFEEYYHGRNRWGKCVKCILDNMISSLNADKKRTFTYVEMSFFEKWYSQLDENRKMNVKTFVEEGRLDFANGGWVMNDEATPYYQHIIDQMRIGMQFLNKEFNYTPRVAWYIDPFGHSLTNAYLLNKLGFDKLVITRIDYREKEKRIKEKSMEFVWRPYFDIDGGQSKILTHVTHGHYSPDGDRFPNLLETDYDDPSRFEGKLDSIYSYFKDMSDAYPTKELLFLFGDDFTFNNENQNFKNIEAMMKAFDSSARFKDKINFFYSTPSKYFADLDSKMTGNFKFLDGVDFFPYSDQKMDYWTGFFTSRPYLKGLVRDAGNYLEQLSSLLFTHLISGLPKFDVQNLIDRMYSLRRELGIAQHHDAVSGTARELVSKDYISRLNNGINGVSEGLKAIVLSDMGSVDIGKFNSICAESASSEDCISKVYDKTQLSQGIMFIYVNPGITGSYPVKIKVESDRSTKGVVIYDMINSKDLSCDLICDIELNHCVINAIMEFSPDKLYNIIRVQSHEVSTEVQPVTLKSDQTPLKIIDSSTNILLFDTEKLTFYQKVKSSGEEFVFSISHGYFTYNSYRDASGSNRSGAYLLATDSETPERFILDREKSKYYVGNTVTEIDLVYEKSKLKLRIYKTNTESDFIVDVESVLFPNHPSKGYEFLLIVSTDVMNINNSGKTEFFTDSNGLRVIKRIQDTRESFDFNVDDKVASNVYPVNSLISLKDKNNKRVVNVFNDRSQAATSIQKGEVLFILNRWSDRDDRKGLADGIDESNSSNINFHLNHWIAINSKFNKEHLYNMINKKPINLSFIQNKSEINNINNEISKLLIKNVDSQIKFNGSMFKLDDKECFEYNFYFISNQKLLIQFMNKYNPHLYDSKSCKLILNDHPLIASIRRVGLNGIDNRANNVDFAKANMISKIFKNFLRPPKTSATGIDYIIKPYEFETFLITFKN